MKSILEYLENVKSVYPQKKAFICNEESITFLELYEKAIFLGARLANQVEFVVKEPICILDNRSIDSIVCMFACLYSGNFYIMIDSNTPQDRKNTLFSGVNPVALIEFENAEIKITSTSTQKIGSYNLKNDYLMRKEDIDLVERIRTRCYLFDPLYGIFTSGSTGVPKLVLKDHKSLVEFIDCFTELFNIGEDEVLGNQFPFYFDASTKDIYLTIKKGITSHIIKKEMFSFPEQLISYLEENEITTIIWVPSALCLVANAGALDDGRRLCNLRKVFFVGEQMPVKQLNYWKEKVASARFINLYGATETAGNFLYYEYDGSLLPSERLPLGQAFPNAKVMILEGDDVIEDTQKVGEICVAGNMLALGYYMDINKTKSVFVQNPNVKYKERMYRTGDLAYYDKNKNIIWACRKDYQVKHMGYRVELSEIEVIIGALPGVLECGCIYDDANKKIVLFYSSECEMKKEIGIIVKEKLPKYMYPGKYIWLESIPHNANGKIDRKRLEEMYRNAK